MRVRRIPSWFYKASYKQVVNYARNNLDKAYEYKLKGKEVKGIFNKFERIIRSKRLSLDDRLVVNTFKDNVEVIIWAY